jgi:hypothetical protein
LFQHLNRSVFAVSVLLSFAALPATAQTTDAVNPSDAVVTSAAAQTTEPSDPPVIGFPPRRTSPETPSSGRRISTEANASGTYGELVLETAGSILLRSIGAIPIIFETNGVDRARFHSDGNMSIGGTNNTARLNVINTVAGSRGLYAAQATAIGANTTQNDTGLYVDAINAVGSGVTNSGSLVGTQVQAWNTGAGTLTNALGIRFFAGNLSTGTITNAYGMQVLLVNTSGTITNGYGVYINDVAATNDYAIYQIGTNDTNYFAGNVGIGTASPTTPLDVTGNIRSTGNIHANGNITADGTLYAKFQDIAEWVPATTDMTPGTVVVLNPARNNEVMASRTSYDTSVAGVVSAQPGLSLGVGSEGMEQIATTGRVKVRIDARSAPIAIGDLLVTGDQPGTAMRSEPMNINGRKFHQPGTIIGKALEPHNGGEGEILVLLSLQ